MIVQDKKTGRVIKKTGRPFPGGKPARRLLRKKAAWYEMQESPRMTRRRKAAAIRIRVLPARVAGVGHG